MKEIENEENVIDLLEYRKKCLTTPMPKSIIECFQNIPDFPLEIIITPEGFKRAE